jgi:hypothetical protein
VGARGSIALVPEALRPFYGRRTPLGGIVFVRIGLAPAAATRTPQTHAGRPLPVPRID